MMTLFWSPRSPFVRKVMIALHELGLEDQVQKVRYVVAMTSSPAQEVLQINPLGKIPALICEDGSALFDSRVICEYLDLQSGNKLFPLQDKKRIGQLRWQALGDGLTDVLLLWRIERMREKGCDPQIANGFETKVRSSMAQLEKEAHELRKQPFGIGHISIICALGQLDFRWPNTGWETYFETLGTWYHETCQRPSILNNVVINDQQTDENESTPVFTFKPH